MLGDELGCAVTGAGVLGASVGAADTGETVLLFLADFAALEDFLADLVVWANAGRGWMHTAAIVERTRRENFMMGSVNLKRKVNKGALDEKEEDKIWSSFDETKQSSWYGVQEPERSIQLTNDPHLGVRDRS